MQRKASALFMFVIAILPNLVAGDTTAPYRTSGEAELFVDDQLIASSSGVTRVLHPARRLEKPILEPTEPWEGQRLYIYGMVRYDGEAQRFKMWYHASGAGILYATSKDGLAWDRPRLGLHEFNGSKENNIVLPEVINPAVFFDEREPDPSKRYKALSGKARNFRGFYSADGLHWTEYPRSPLIDFGSELATINRDPKTGEFLVYLRPYSPKPKIEKPEHKRTCSLTTSTDFLNWTPMQSVVVPDEIDDVWTQSAEQRTEFYSIAGFPYGSQYIGLIPTFRLTGILDTKLPEQSRYDGPIDVQLIHSRDGRTWQRTKDRKAIIANGPAGSYDAGTLLHVANNPLIVGDEVWHYYTAINTTHGGPMPPKRGVIALATWRLDGFASLRANWADGIVQTIPMSSDGNVLEINAEASRGSVGVEILNADGSPIPGYGLADCVPLDSDAVRHRVSWKGKGSFDSSKGFVLRFHLRNADLYSFRVIRDQATE